MGWIRLLFRSLISMLIMTACTASRLKLPMLRDAGGFNEFYYKKLTPAGNACISCLSCSLRSHVVVLTDAPLPKVMPALSEDNDVDFEIGSLTSIQIRYRRPNHFSIRTPLQPDRAAATHSFFDSIQYNPCIRNLILKTVDAELSTRYTLARLMRGGGRLRTTRPARSQHAAPPRKVARTKGSLQEAPPPEPAAMATSAIRKGRGRPPRAAAAPSISTEPSAGGAGRSAAGRPTRAARGKAASAQGGAASSTRAAGRGGIARPEQPEAAHPPAGLPPAGPRGRPAAAKADPDAQVAGPRGRPGRRPAAGDRAAAADLGGGALPSADGAQVRSAGAVGADGALAGARMRTRASAAAAPVVPAASPAGEALAAKGSGLDPALPIAAAGRSAAANPTVTAAVTAAVTVTVTAAVTVAVTVDGHGGGHGGGQSDGDGDGDGHGHGGGEPLKSSMGTRITSMPARR